MKIEQYIQSALFKFLRTKPIDTIRVIDIIDDVGICKGTFYKYYQDKYQLLISSFQNCYYKEILKGADSWEKFAEHSLNSFKNSPAVIINAFESADINSLRKYHEKLMLGCLFNGSGREEEEYYAFSAEIFTRCATDIILEWLKDKCQETNAQVIGKMKAIMPVTLFNGLYGSAE